MNLDSDRKVSEVMLIKQLELDAMKEMQTERLAAEERMKVLEIASRNFSSIALITASFMGLAAVVYVSHSFLCSVMPFREGLFGSKGTIVALESSQMLAATMTSIAYPLTYLACTGCAALLLINLSEILINTGVLLRQLKAIAGGTTRFLVRVARAFVRK